VAITRNSQERLTDLSKLEVWMRQSQTRENDAKAAAPSIDPDRDRDLEMGRRWSVLLCDGAHNRRELIRRIIEQAGGIAWIAETGAAPASVISSGCDPVALVGLGGAGQPNPAPLDLIHSLKGAGVSVIAYEDGVKQWPVRAKCLPLVSGATHLLDSSDAGFAGDLRRILEQMFQALAGKYREEQELRREMRRNGMVGESSAFIDAFRAAMRFSALSDLPVLITGESGTGKELLARAIGRMDPKRKDGPFITVNCAAVNPALMESEFFGHRRGAFTGAERDRKGLIRAADGGVLFLDEIGELDAGLQAKLLRVLQENRVLGVGEEREIAVNVRFMAATNRNLEQLVADGKFRADLFHRLRVLLIYVPILRERPADIPSLIEFFVEKHHGLLAGPAARVSRDFLDAVQQLELPGNVRQLENLIRQSLVNHRHQGELDLGDLPVDALRQLSMRSLEGPSDGAGAAQPSPPPRPSQPEMNELVKRILDNQGWNLSRALRECERQVFQAAMLRTRGNQSQAARLLGITPRCVYNKVRKHLLPQA
jgi:DNA-binding NtrC family response regulator